MKLNNQVINWVFLLFLGVRWSAFNGKYAHAWTHKVILQQSPCGNHLISGLKQSPKDLMDVVVSKKTDVLTLPAVCRGKSCAFHWKSRFTVYLSNVLHVFWHVRWIHMLAIELRLCRERTDHLRSWGFGDKRSSQRADRGSGNWVNPAADCAALLYLHLRWTEEGVACSSLMDQGSAACWVEECIHCAPDSAQWDSQSALPGPGNDHDYAKCGLSVLCWWWIWYVTERRRGVTTALASFSYLNLWKKKKKKSYELTNPWPPHEDTQSVARMFVLFFLHISTQVVNLKSFWGLSFLPSLLLFHLRSQDSSLFPAFRERLNTFHRS